MGRNYLLAFLSIENSTCDDDDVLSHVNIAANTKFVMVLGLTTVPRRIQTTTDSDESYARQPSRNLSRLLLQVSAFLESAEVSNFWRHYKEKMYEAATAAELTRRSNKR